MPQTHGMYSHTYTQHGKEKRGSRPGYFCLVCKRVSSVLAGSQEKGQLPSWPWKDLQNPLPHLVGIFRVCDFWDLDLFNKQFFPSLVMLFYHLFSGGVPFCNGMLSDLLELKI